MICGLTGDTLFFFSFYFLHTQANSTYRHAHIIYLFFLSPAVQQLHAELNKEIKED